MKIKTTVLTLSCALTGALTLQAQQTTRVNAIKANDYGVVYTLPKTSFDVTILVKKTTLKRGEYYQYAQHLIGVEKPVVADEVIYSIESIDVENVGIPDKANSFMVEFRSNTAQPFVLLHENGTIVAVNTEVDLDKKAELVLPANKSAISNPKRFLSQEVLMAGSIAKQAELVSRQIFDLRRSKSDILTGESDNMPPDGNAYKVVMDEINLQEAALTSLFAGSEETEYFTQKLTVIPEDDKSLDNVVIGRFSSKLGLVDSDDLSGEPIYFSLKNKTPQVEMQLSERDLQRLEEKLTSGLVYNIPGQATLSVTFKHNTLVNKEVDVVQYGTKDVLVKKMFDNRKESIKVLFHPELGAIKQIIQ